MKYLFTGIIAGIIAGITIGYLLFNKNIETPATITVIKPAKTEWTVKPENADYKKCYESDIKIDYSIDDQAFTFMNVSVRASDACKIARTEWRIDYPQSVKKNIIGIDSGLIYNNGIKLYYKPSYYRMIYSGIYVGGGVIISSGAEIGIKFIF